jgi:hypothetical protein
MGLSDENEEGKKKKPNKQGPKKVTITWNVFHSLGVISAIFKLNNHCTHIIMGT